MNGTSDLAADLRFTHAEEIFPLATLLGLPGSTKPSCRPVRKGSYFYDLTELKRCYDIM